MYFKLGVLQLIPSTLPQCRPLHAAEKHLPSSESKSSAHESAGQVLCFLEPSKCTSHTKETYRVSIHMLIMYDEVCSGINYFPVAFLECSGIFACNSHVEYQLQQKMATIAMQVVVAEALRGRSKAYQRVSLWDAIGPICWELGCQGELIRIVSG